MLNKDNDILNTHIVVVNLFKRDRKLKIYDAKDEDCTLTIAL